ncbi:hypothetical protein BAUCODRAFT_36447 [Baudoinia panamericana UAMH 10762]|uniref:Uncharacterized protein n=1 Tax=Baudoinia panamericana (strain UAMH 10762) TaxID=717646 RepID=M2MR91_BAUPA|nr:uncharacterized protein BAUCODRAFT_36447 [Baudoinia panamericana UAMH 10762]EMC93973.1 hypothetical protein BAUCODRAFT_36447 [Baudoinia panamericana UAMH 10762]
MLLKASWRVDLLGGTSRNENNDIAHKIALQAAAGQTNDYEVNAPSLCIKKEITLK